MGEPTTSSQREQRYLPRAFPRGVFVSSADESGTDDVFLLNAMTGEQGCVAGPPHRAALMKERCKIWGKNLGQRREAGQAREI